MSRACPPLPAEDFGRLLLEAAREAGLEVPPSCLGSLSRYLSELDRWRRAVNLTGELSTDDLAAHAVEALAGAALIPDGIELIDIGSGAGFPGAPLALARPDISVTLLEPRSKRAAFLRHVARTVPVPNVVVLEDRIENLAEASWDAATTRAVGGMGRFLGKGAFLRPGGLLLCWTTQPAAVSAVLAPRFLPDRTEKLPGRGVIAALRKA
jgi:16S rRNA (guanine527-N7)-methyltransferase